MKEEALGVSGSMTTKKISKTKEMHAGIERVWAIFADTNKDPEYWDALRDIKVVSNDGTTVVRDATVGPRAFSHKSHQVITLEPRKSIKLKMTGDPMAGERMITFVPMGRNSTRVDVEWDLNLQEVPGFVRALVEGQMSRATDKALDRIAEATEKAEREGPL
jgi:carbon monoxide dehydrogenase subunit G